MATVFAIWPGQPGHRVGVRGAVRYHHLAGAGPAADFPGRADQGSARRLPGGPRPAAPRGRYPKMSKYQYLGAAVIALITIESMEEREVPNSLGPLNDLFPYVMLRWQREPDLPFPVLPVPCRFQQLFTEWAANIVDFIDGNAGTGYSRSDGD